MGLLVLSCRARTNSSHFAFGLKLPNYQSIINIALHHRIYWSQPNESKLCTQYFKVQVMSYHTYFVPSIWYHKLHFSSYTVQCPIYSHSKWQIYIFIFLIIQFLSYIFTLQIFNLVNIQKHECMYLISITTRYIYICFGSFKYTQCIR